MTNRRSLKPLRESDHWDARDIYADAVESQGNVCYSIEQIRAWSALAWLPGVLDRPLREGMGWVSLDNELPMAFAVRYPPNRLALLYCRGSASRLGHGSLLLSQIEFDAFKERQAYLFTEASSFSFALLLKNGWIYIRPETIEIGGVRFTRYLMKKKLSSD